MILKSYNEKDVIAFADRLSSKIHHAGIMNTVPSFTTEIEKCETIRDLSILEWEYPLIKNDGVSLTCRTKEKSDKYTDNNYRKKKKKKTFSFLKEIQELGGCTCNLKPLFNAIYFNGE